LYPRIEFRTEEEDIHTEIQPQHAQNYGGQASVGGHQASHIVDVEGIEI
jgi:hypothetical protein